MNYVTKDEDSFREIIMPRSIIRTSRDEFVILVNDFCSSSLDTLIINFEETIMIDSAGLGLLLIARNKIQEHGKKLILQNPAHHVKELFRVMRYESIFTINHSNIN